MKLKAIVLVSVLIISLCCPLAYADKASHESAAEEMLLLTNPDQMMEKIWEQVDAMTKQQFQQMGAPEKFKPVIKEYSDKMFQIIKDDLSFENMKSDLIKIYVKTYSESEIRAIIDFYKSPVGEVFLQKMPKLMEESMAITQKKMPYTIQKIQALTKELKKEVDNLKSS